MSIWGNKFKPIIFIIIIKHSPTSIRRIQRRNVGSARHKSKPFAKRHVPHQLIRGPHRPKVFTSLTDVFNFFICSEQALWSSAFLIYIFFYFFAQNSFIFLRRWSAIEIMKICHRNKWNSISLGAVSAILSHADCFPFLDFLFFCSPAQFQSSYTSWQTSLLLNGRGAPSARCVMPVGIFLRLPMHLISIEQAHIWSAPRASSSMVDPLEQT